MNMFVIAAKSEGNISMVTTHIFTQILNKQKMH